MSCVLFLLVSAAHADPFALRRNPAIVPAEFAAVGAGDVDGDGRDELFVLDEYGELVVTTFEDDGRVTTTTLDGVIPTSNVLYFDFDGDGLDDVVGKWSTQVRVWSQGQGWAQVFSGPITGTMLTAVDVDADGWLDVLTSNGSWWRNLGGAGLQEIPVDPTATWILAGHIDADPHIDMVTGHDLGAITIHYGDGTGLAWTTAPLSRPQPQEAVGACLGDLDGDGNIDLLATSRYDGEVHWGDPLAPSGFEPGELVAVGLGEPYQDLYVWCDAAGGHVLAVYGPGPRTMGWVDVGPARIPSAESTLRTVGTDPNYIRRYNLDADPELELVLEYDYGTFYLPDFPSPSLDVLSLSSNAVAALHSGDVDGDGDADVVLAHEGVVQWFENPGLGTNWTWREIAFKYTLAYNGLTVATDLADMDGDLDLDFVLWDASDGSLLIFWNEDGAGGAWTTEWVGWASEVAALTTGDLTGDALPDILTAGSPADSEARLWDVSSGTWQSSVLFSEAPPDRYAGIRLFDVDEDGDLDVILGTEDHVYYRANLNGLGTLWSEVQIHSQTDEGEHFEVVDMDGDGDLDIVASGFDQYSVLEQTGAGGTAWSRKSGSGVATRQVAVADFDGSGFPDVLMAHSDLSVHLSEYPLSSLWNYVDCELVNDQHYQVVTLDVDGDTDPDAVSWQDDGPLRVRRNHLLAPANDLDHDGIDDAVDGCPTYYDPEQLDPDQDGFTNACDCRDEDPGAYPGAPELCDLIDQDCDGDWQNGFDQDGDGFTSCGVDGVELTVDDDCDDSRADVYPGAVEVCDGFDNDCDGVAEPVPVDLDGDGVDTCTDCDDGEALVAPTLPEVPYDGLDNDCDPTTPDDDLDGDGFDGATDCEDLLPQVNPAAVELPYNGLDDDCDPTTPDDDLDGDGYGAATDCDDTDAAVSPGVAEVPYNSIDDDCDPATPDNDLDDDGYAVPLDCDDADPLANPGRVETPYNGVDDDCDPTTPDDDLDGDGAPLATDCDDTNAVVGPDADEEPYNGVDDDCDPATPDDDLDGDGVLVDQDCDDDDPDRSPERPELPYNGVDDDCDESTPDDDLDGDGFVAATDCADADPAVSPGAAEICDNQIDDNCDGTVDCPSSDADDKGCGCSVPGAPNGFLLPLLALGLLVRRRTWSD